MGKLFCTFAAETGVDYILPSPITVSSEHSRTGEACLKLVIVDDGIAEGDECLLVSVGGAGPIAPVSDLFCIIDNDGKLRAQFQIDA